MATTVIIIRHADKDIPPIEADPPLNKVGEARSRELAHVLKRAGIRAIYTSNAKRAKMTAIPFSLMHLMLPVVRLDDAPDLKTHILDHHEGQTVLVVGHAGTVPELITQLGGPALKDIPEMTGELIERGGVLQNELNDFVFDNLFVLVRHSAREVSLTRLKYGAATSPG